MKNILCVDIGKVRIGAALKLGDQDITPLPVLDRAQNRALKELIALVEENDIHILVAGIPLDESNNETSQSADVRSFLSRFAKRVDLPIMLVDEYASSTDALETLGITSVTKSLRKKGIVDSLAAMEILRAYLNNRGVVGAL